MRQPGPCVRALCEPVARLLSKNMTCAGPRCNATPSEHFLHTSYCTLHTPHFTLHTCTSSHLKSSHLKSCELFSPHLSSSHLISTVFILSEHWSTFLISSKFFSTHLSCSARQKALTVREKSLAQKNHWAQKAFAHKSLRHRCIYTEKPLQNTVLCTTKLPQSISQYTTCTTKLAQSTSQALLCTTKLAQSTSQYYFVVQSVHKARPSTTLYYKACTKYFPVLLCTTQLAQNTSQYYFVLQSLHKALPSTTLHYKSLRTVSRTTVYYKALTSTTL